MWDDMGFFELIWELISGLEFKFNHEHITVLKNLKDNFISFYGLPWLGLICTVVRTEYPDYKTKSLLNIFK